MKLKIPKNSRKKKFQTYKKDTATTITHFKPMFLLLYKSMDWFLCFKDLRHERVKNIRKPLANPFHTNAQFLYPLTTSENL